jgi:hypothetical protein
LKLAVISAILVPGFTFAAAPFGVATAAVAARLASVVALPVAMHCLKVQVALSVRRLLADQAPIWLAAAAMALAVGLLSTANIGAASPTIALASLKVICGAATFVIVVLILAPGYLREVRGTLLAAFSNAPLTR